MPHVTVEVNHANKLTQLLASFWNCEGLYGNNSVTSDVITQIVKFVDSKERFSGVDFEPSLLEAGEHLFEDSKMFFPRAFCYMQKVIDLNTHCV